MPADIDRYARAASRAGRAPRPERYRARTLDNPLYRAQLTSARLGRVLAQASAFGVRVDDQVGRATAVRAVSVSGADPATEQVARLLADYPAVADRGDYPVTRYLADLSALVLAWLETVELWPPEPSASPLAEHETRCAVAEAARIVVLSSLTLLDITTPERI